MRRFLRRCGWRFGQSVLLVMTLVLCPKPGASAAENSATQTTSSPDTGDIKLRAEAGDPAAQETYAIRLETGRYHVEAAKWYRRAADAGRADSQFRLGAMLLKGFPSTGPGHPALHAQPLAAIGLLTKAAEQGHDKAQLELGKCLYSGIGVSPNPVEAYRWLLLSAESNPNARVERDRVALTLTTGQIQKAQERARAFRAGDRSDPRIRIVTQADLEADKEPPAVSFPAGTPAPTKEPGLSQTDLPAPPRSHSDGELTNTAPAKVGTGNDVSNSAVTKWLSKLLSNDGGRGPFAGARRLMVPLVLTGVVVVLCLIGFMVIVGRSQRRRTTAISPNAVGPVSPPVVRKMTRTSPPRELEHLRSIDRHEFETLMEHAFAQDGFQVTPVNGKSRDIGIDLMMSRDGVRTGVQCRYWKQRQIGIKEVQEFLGAMKAVPVERGIILTISNYTAAASELAHQFGVQILDGAHLTSLLQKHGIQVGPQLQAA